MKLYVYMKLFISPVSANILYYIYAGSTQLFRVLEFWMSTLANTIWIDIQYLSERSTYSAKHITSNSSGSLICSGEIPNVAPVRWILD